MPARRHPPSVDVLGRVSWMPHEQDEIAAKVADVLGKPEFSTSEMMVALRQVNATLGDRKRVIRGPSQFPWLRKKVIEKLSHVINLTIPVVVEQDENDLTHRVDVMFSELTRMRTRIGVLERRIRKILRRRNSEIPEHRPTTIKFAVAGIERGDQETQIKNRLKGFPNIKLEFINTRHRPPASITSFTYMIIMKWVSAKWALEAQRTYPGKTIVATGIVNAVDIIIRKTNGVSN